jgi:hypothetical protein
VRGITLLLGQQIIEFSGTETKIQSPIDRWRQYLSDRRTTDFDTAALDVHRKKIYQGGA